MNRADMIEVLTRNEIDWLVGDPTQENINGVIRFFTGGGFYTYPDQKITKMYEDLTA